MAESGGGCSYVKLWKYPLGLDMVKEGRYDLVISYNYRYIVKEDVIQYLGDKIINMHISYLPWNKGASPNIWSFIEDTPKGVTIHRLEKGLDSGKIIVQKEVRFDENVETLASSYDKLNDEIVQLLISNWEMISRGEYSMMKENGKGSYHKMSDLDDMLNGKKIDYNMTISEFKQFVAALQQE